MHGVDRETTIPDLFAWRVMQTPGGVAQRQRDRAGLWQDVTWRELDHEVRQAAAHLRRLGLEFGDHLAILAHTGRAWQVYELAGLLEGAVIVGLDPLAPAASLEYLIEHVSSIALVAQSRALLARLPESGKVRFKFLLALDGPAPSLPLRQTPPQPAQRYAARCGPDSTAALLLSSGTTGDPKAISFSHRQLLTAAHAILAAFPALGPGQSHLCWLPMSHLFQRMLNLAALAGGLATSFCEDPRQVFQCLQDAQPTCFVGVPRFFEKLHENLEDHLAARGPVSRKMVRYAFQLARQRAEAARAGRRLSLARRAQARLLDRLVLRRIRDRLGRDLRFMVSGSAPLAVGIIEYFQALGLPILEAYGTSENCVPIALNRLEACRPGSVGRPLAPNAVALAPDGEVLLKGPGLSRDFQGDCDRQGFYGTGDLGYLDADGYLYLSGRKKTILKTSTGHRIAPERIEAAYRQCPGVEQAVVIGEGRPYLTGLLDLAGRAPERAVLCAALARAALRLTPHERIRRFAILPEPLRIESGELTSSLKVRRGVVEKRYRDLIERLYEGESELISEPLREASKGVLCFKTATR